nr:retrovirus-related Pol polyprotein from transposon TNT 1-94 [Tanacetum cinerariifolium]
MSTQHDIYAAGSENRPPMLNKYNYVPWSSRIIRYARSRPNGKMIVESIENGPYLRRMIASLGEPDLPVPAPESFYEQTDKELIETDIKRMDADNQAIQTILLVLPEDIYAAVDSYETAKEIWERVRQMMKVRQSKNLHKADFTQIYDFLKMNQDEENELRAKRLTKSHDPLALMAHSQGSYNFLTTHKDQSSSSTHSQQSFPINNKYNPQPSLNQNFMQSQMTSLEYINDPTEAINAALILFAKAFQLSAPTNNNQRTSSNPRNRQISQPVMNIVAQNQQGYNAWQNGGSQVAHSANGTGNVLATRAEGTGIGNQTQLPIAQKEEAGIQLQAEEFDFMAAAGDLDEIEEVNANCILMENLQQASTSGTQHDKAPVYDTDGSTEVHLNDNCYDNEIFNMFTQEEEYTDLLEPILKPQLVPQNDNHVTSVAPSMVQSGGTVETSFAPNEKTRAHQETVYRNLIDQVAQVVQICLWCVDSGCSKHMIGNIKLLINFVWKFLGIVRFGNDYIAAILGYGDLKWGNITITRVYFVEGLDHNLFLIGQFCEADLEVAFRRNTCFIRDLDGINLIIGNRSTNLYTINLYDMALASHICLIARATPTKSWLWHQRLSHLNFDTINDLSKNDLVFGLPKFKYAKEHLCPSCEQGKSKRASHPPKPVPNSKQWLHLLHMDLCGPVRVASINGKWTKKIMKTMNVTFDELLAMAFEQNSLRPGLQSMTSRQISFELELTYAPSTITPQRPSEHDLDILFEPLHNEYLGGRPSEVPRTIHVAPVIQNLQAPTESMSF